MRVPPVPRFWGPGIRPRFEVSGYDDHRDMCRVPQVSILRPGILIFSGQTGATCRRCLQIITNLAHTMEVVVNTRPKMTTPQAPTREILFPFHKSIFSVSSPQNPLTPTPLPCGGR